MFANSKKYAEAIELIKAGDKLLLTVNDRQGAIKKYDESLEFHPSPAGYSHKARALLEQSKYDEAINCCDEALKLKKNYVYAHFVKGNIYHVLAQNCPKSEESNFEPHRAEARKCYETTRRYGGDDHQGANYGLEELKDLAISDEYYRTPSAVSSETSIKSVDSGIVTDDKDFYSDPKDFSITEDTIVEENGNLSLDKLTIDENLVKQNHEKALNYLADHSESVDYTIIKQVYEILDKAINSTYSIKENINKAIGKIQKIELETQVEKQVAVLELLEGFYNKYSFFCEKNELEDTFVAALSYLHETTDKDKGLQGFIEDMYTGYFEE